MRESGQIVDLKGKNHSIRKGAKIHAYIIDDLKPKMRKLLSTYNFTESWDETGYFLFHENANVFIEAVSYDKMIQDAKLRNATFFDLLMGDILPADEKEPETECALT